jgi:Amt family ammonium transporter
MAVAAAIVYSGAMSFILLKVIGSFIPLQAGVSNESAGLDITQHGEEAYLHVGGASSQAHAG